MSLPRRVLALDAALARCSAALVADGAVLAERSADGARGHAALLPLLIREVLAETAGSFDAVAVTIGPGGFTGLRAALALAQGMALGAECPVLGVTVGEALAAGLDVPGREIWTAIDTRRGRVHLERDGTVTGVALESLPAAPGPVALAGDAAPEVAERLAAAGADVLLTEARLPLARHVAAAALRRMAAGLPPRPALPLYVDPPEVRLPARPPRPAPAG